MRRPLRSIQRAPRCPSASLVITRCISPSFSARSPLSGWPRTRALNEGAIDEDAFLEQSKLIQKEREAMFFSVLDHTRHGVVACVFDTTDRVQHMFYRYLEPARASRRTLTSLSNSIATWIASCAARRQYVDTDTALFVLSDHGFCPFRRA